MNKVLLMFLVVCAAELGVDVSSLSSSPAIQSSADSAERARVVHALNRLGYGPRPGDVGRVLAIGLDQYIEQQLHPQEIDDERLYSVLRDFDVLSLTKADFLHAWKEERKLRRKAEEMRAADEVADTPSTLQDAFRETRARTRKLNAQVQQLAIVRAALSERQLYEVLVDFWTNHFNVFLAKGPTRFLTHSYIEHVIRPHAMGTFEELLIATAQSPAMLLYLDNAQSVMPGSRSPDLERAQRRVTLAKKRIRTRRTPDSKRNDLVAMEERLGALEARQPRGLNENYARELLELHTLGVDGGYTQDDVVAVARILTGWSVRLFAGEFVFHAWAHDDGEKMVMGRRFPSGRGMDEGIELLRMLASHPSTIRHVSHKLCARFVADLPPDACIEAGMSAWERTDGDITSVVAAIVRSPTFWAEEHRGTKTKTPLEFVASSVRALAATPSEHPSLAVVVARLGQPLYLQPAPTGYPEVQEPWLNAGALLARMNVALAFASGRIEGVEVSLDRVTEPTSDTHMLVQHVNQVVLHGSAAPNTLDILQREASSASSPAQARMLVIGLALGSPEFQRQ